MRVVTWNVNSIRVRIDRLLAFLDREQPDVVCLQELKVTDDAFPVEVLRDAGYHAVTFGQKTYNGVAILSRQEPHGVRRGLGDDVDDVEARAIQANVNGVDIISVYVPNGKQVESDKWFYKLEWLDRLARYVDGRWQPADRLLICGDFNIAPTDADVARPDEWRDGVLCHDEVRRRLRDLCDWGFEDMLRARHPGVEGPLTWWDYRMLGFPKNNGLRIDHILATRPLADVCTDARVDRDERKGKQPSDHAPVLADFAIQAP